MIQLDIPYRGVLTLQHAVFDINGTLAIDGLPIAGVAERLKELSVHLRLHALTAATHGNSEAIEQALGLPLRVIIRAEEKQQYVEQLGPSGVVAFGNGMNDIGMLRLAALGVAILGAEGLAARTLQAADVVVASPIEALDLLLHPKRLLATLRG